MSGFAPEDPISCWICFDPEVMYVDVLNMGWCQKDFDETYLQPPPKVSRG